MSFFEIFIDIILENWVRKKIQMLKIWRWIFAFKSWLYFIKIRLFFKSFLSKVIITETILTNYSFANIFLFFFFVIITFLKTCFLLLLKPPIRHRLKKVLVQTLLLFRINIILLFTFFINMNPCFFLHPTITLCISYFMYLSTDNRNNVFNFFHWRKLIK